MNKVMVYACRLLMIWAFIPFGMNAQTAKWAIAPQYSSITPYGEDMYKVKIGKQVGVVDKDGKIIVGVYADSITNMVEDCSLVLRFVDGKNKLVSILHKDKTTSQISEDCMWETILSFLKANCRSAIKREDLDILGLMAG